MLECAYYFPFLWIVSFRYTPRNRITGQRVGASQRRMNYAAQELMKGQRPPLPSNEWGHWFLSPLQHYILLFSKRCSCNTFKMSPHCLICLSLRAEKAEENLKVLFWGSTLCSLKIKAFHKKRKVVAAPQYTWCVMMLLKE